jgi:hypothetical protein
MADDDLKKVQQDQNDFQRSLNSVNNLFQSLNQGQQQNNNNTGNASTGTTGGGTSNQSEGQ